MSTDGHGPRVRPRALTVPMKWPGVDMRGRPLRRLAMCAHPDGLGFAVDCGCPDAPVEGPHVHPEGWVSCGMLSRLSEVVELFPLSSGPGHIYGIVTLHPGPRPDVVVLKHPANGRSWTYRVEDECVCESAPGTYCALTMRWPD